MYIKSTQDKRIPLWASKTSSSKLSDANWGLLPLFLLLILFPTFIFINLVKIQLVDGKQYLKAAQRVSRSEEVLIPPRGLIYDSTGKRLVQNVPAYSLYINALELQPENETDTINRVANALQIKATDVETTYKTAVYKDGVRQKIERVTIMKQINFDKYIYAIEQLGDLPGVYIEAESVRNYEYDQYMSHILGYIGDPTQQDIDAGVLSIAQIGKTGIELEYDEYLRGIEGVEILEKSVVNGDIVTYKPQDYKPGDSLHLTIDLEWQLAMHKILEAELDRNKAFAGAAVIMEADTGKVVTSVSLPSYSANAFARGITAPEYQELINNPKTPMLNRAIAVQLSPGSTFKFITAVLLLNENLIEANTLVSANACMDLPGGIKFCEYARRRLGDVNIYSALEKSSNIYFCTAVLQNSNFPSLLADYSKRFGIGSKTGIDISGEQNGRIASPEVKEALLGEAWYTGDGCNAAIGQGLVASHPLQMTVAVSAIVNGGKIMQPYLLDSISDQDGQEVFANQPKITSELGVDQQVLLDIKQGMRQAATKGTASRLASSPGEPIAKTGSAEAAELIQGKLYKGAHSWAVGCFKYNEKDYCYTVFQQWGGLGNNSVPTIQLFLDCLYSDIAKCGQ